MFSHVTLGVADFDRSYHFYEALLQPLGARLKFCERDEPCAAWAMPNSDRPLFVICAPYDEKAATPGNGQMVAFVAHERATVEKCYAIAIAQGAKDEGGPGLRPHYHAAYYGAYFRDLDGNKICVCCHSPAEGRKQQ